MKLPTNCLCKKGFTLVELLVSVSIITILTGALIPAFSGYINNQSIKQARSQVLSDLRSIQNRALTGDSSDKKISGMQVLYWGMKFTTNSDTYTVFLTDDSTSNGCNSASHRIDQNVLKLPTGYRIGSNSGCVFMDFKFGDISTYNISTSTIDGLSTYYVYIQRIGTSTNTPINRQYVYFRSNGLIFTR